MRSDRALIWAMGCCGCVCRRRLRRALQQTSCVRLRHERASMGRSCRCVLMTHRALQMSRVLAVASVLHDSEEPATLLLSLLIDQPDTTDCSTAPLPHR